MVRSQYVAIHLVQHIFCKEREIVAAASVSLGGKDKFYDGGEIIPMPFNGKDKLPMATRLSTCPLMERINSMTAMTLSETERLFLIPSIILIQ